MDNKCTPELLEKCDGSKMAGEAKELTDEQLAAAAGGRESAGGSKCPYCGKTFLSESYRNKHLPNCPQR